MLRRAGLSFLAMTAGWFWPSILFVTGAAVMRSGVESALAIAFWTGIFVFAAWLLIALPIALFVSPSHFLFRRKVAPLFGAVIGFAAMSWTLAKGVDGWWLAAYGLLVGAIAGFAYSWFLREKTPVAQPA
jgi:hypothetical protein